MSQVHDHRRNLDALSPYSPWNSLTTIRPYGLLTDTTQLHSRRFIASVGANPERSGDAKPRDSSANAGESAGLPERATLDLPWQAGGSLLWSHRVDPPSACHSLVALHGRDVCEQRTRHRRSRIQEPRAVSKGGDDGQHANGCQGIPHSGCSTPCSTA